MVKKTKLVLIIVSFLFLLICISLIFKNTITSCVVSLFRWPYTYSRSIQESRGKGVFLFKYHPSKDFLSGKNGETLIYITDTVFAEKKYKLSCKNMKGIEVLESSTVMIIPCLYKDSFYHDYFYKWNLNPPFSAHPNKICAFFTKGSANQYTFPPDTLKLLLIDNTIDLCRDTLDNYCITDSIMLIKDD